MNAKQCFLSCLGVLIAGVASGCVTGQRFHVEISSVAGPGALNDGTCVVLPAIEGVREDDLLAVVRPGLDGIVLSKAHTAETVRRADHYITILERQQGMETGTVSIIPLVESADGILNSRAISAASPRLVGLSLGAEDLAVDMGLQRSEEAREIEWPRAQLATAAAAADLVAIDTPEPDYTDMEHLERDSSYARSLGFRGKYCIHPGQVEVVNRVFSQIGRASCRGRV